MAIWHEERLLIDGDLVPATIAEATDIPPGVVNVLAASDNEVGALGLSGGVLSADRDRALAVARRIRTGTMSVNGGVYYAPDAPFGGYKQSGIGREMGVADLAEFVELKTFAEPAG